MAINIKTVTICAALIIAVIMVIAFRENIPTLFGELKEAVVGAH